MKYFSLLIFSVLFSTAIQAQNPGDTIRVQALTFDNSTRDWIVNFPDDPDLTYEKVMLKYTMRCKGGLVSTGASPNLGCGEWDYSCNTYLVDSSKIEALLSTVSSHHITNYAEPNFLFHNAPVYNYLRGTQTNTQIDAVSNEAQAVMGTGSIASSRMLSTSNLAGKSQYLYTAAELTAAGVAAGEIAGLSLNMLSNVGEARYLKIKVKNSSKAELNGLIDFDDFEEVYYANTTMAANQLNRFQFHTPFVWDGSSNVLVEFNFSNIDAAALSETLVESETTGSKMGLSSTSESEMMLTNNSYIECDTYKGVGGSQNRTVEAWIRTSNGTNGEIVSWGSNVASKKWVFRLANGLLRVEVNGGGAVSETRVDDGKWHHVACVLDGTNLQGIQFYIDGVLDGISEANFTAIDTDNVGGLNVRISRGVNNRYLDGLIDDVRIWDTNLSGEAINEWKSLKINDTHPYFANLQLNYEFSEAGNQIVDESDYARTASLIGTEYKVAEQDGASLFKDFVLGELRPNVIFYSGDYTTTVSTTEVDKPIVKQPQHFVVTRSIASGNPNVIEDDVIINSEPVQYWTPFDTIFNEITGEVIESNILSVDGEIDIFDLEYFRRFPFYNELVSFVTPYGIGLNLGAEGKSWYMDMSDYVSILKGDKRMVMTLGGQNQEEMDLEFLFIVGTPPRDVVQYDQIWQGTNRQGHASISQLITNTKFAPYTLPLVDNASTFKLKSSITGHGAEGEFHQIGGPISHKILIDDVEEFTWIVTQECSMNPIFPQGGTWVYDRQGWCPGERSLMKEQDLTSLVTPGGNMKIDYATSSPQSASGDYRYHVAHQLVGYGDANFQLDASVVEIIAPNNSAEYTRVGNICANPRVRIRNTGATKLTQLKLNYWINDSQAPQSFVWNGNLDFMEEEVVIIPSGEALWYDILEDNNKFHVEVSNPNGGADEYLFNNRMSSDFEVPQVIPSNFIIEVRTNNNPNENQYQLFSSSGTLVGSNNLPAANTNYNDDYDLAPKCYRLVVSDSGGDGLQWWANNAQGTGYVRLKSESGSIIRIFEADFGGGFEYSFTTDFPLSTEDLSFLTNIKVFPNPADNFFTVEGEELLSATLKVTDIMGRVVDADVISNSDKAITFNTTNLDAGIYFVVINKGEIVTTRKVVIE